MPGYLSEACKREPCPRPLLLSEAQAERWQFFWLSWQRRKAQVWIVSALSDAILIDCSESLKICKTPSFSRVSPPGHSNGHVSVGTNGHPAGTLFPTDTVRWARPQPKMAFAPPYGGTASQAGSESVETNG